MEDSGRKTNRARIVADTQESTLQPVSMGQLVRFGKGGYAVDITHRHGNAKPPAGSASTTQGVRPAGRHFDHGPRRKIPHGERMYAAQKFFMEYSGFSFAYRLLVGFRASSCAWATPLRIRPSIFALRPKNAAWTGTGRLRRASIAEVVRFDWTDFRGI